MQQLQYTSQDIDQLSSQIAYWQARAIQAEQDLDHERQENAELNERLTALVDWQDLNAQVLRSAGMSPVYKMLYLSLIDTYPSLMEGEKTPVQVWRIRANAGWISKESGTKFFQDMVEVAAMEYEDGKYDPKKNEREGYITINTDLFPYPEKIKTKACERRRAAREKEQNKLKEYRSALQILQCESCGSPRIVNDITAKCAACGHVHATVKDIPANMMIIQAEVTELPDDLSPGEDELIDVLASPEPEEQAETQRQREEAVRQAEELAALPTTKKRSTPCMICDYEKRESEWIWDRGKGQWICSNQALHGGG